MEIGIAVIVVLLLCVGGIIFGMRSEPDGPSDSEVILRQAKEWLPVGARCQFRFLSQGWIAGTVEVEDRRYHVSGGCLPDEGGDGTLHISRPGINLGSVPYVDFGRGLEAVIAAIRHIGEIEKTPNKAPDRTAPSVTAPAAQEPRH